MATPQQHDHVFVTPGLVRVRACPATEALFYAGIHWGGVEDEIQFDWDADNRLHLAAHSVPPEEFEQVMWNEPVDLEYQNVKAEDRYRSVGLTNSVRILVLVWTGRANRVRAVTAPEAEN